MFHEDARSRLLYALPTTLASSFSLYNNADDQELRRPVVANSLGGSDIQLLLQARPACHYLAFQTSKCALDSLCTVHMLIYAQPPPPGPEFPKNPKGRIAVIGAGLTGVSSAAHAIAHGFDVVIYEQGDSVGELPISSYIILQVVRN